jgi:hypothetical protein
MFEIQDHVINTKHFLRRGFLYSRHVTEYLNEQFTDRTGQDVVVRRISLWERPQE